MTTGKLNLGTDFPRGLSVCITYLHRSRSKFMNEKLRDFGFSGSMYMILLHVNSFPGTSQDDIVNRMHIDKCNVTRRANRLLELGYIRREISSQDRRKNSLFLTDKGRGVVPVIREYLGQWSNSVSETLTNDERQTLLELLTKITSAGMFPPSKRGESGGDTAP